MDLSDQPCALPQITQAQAEQHKRPCSADRFPPGEIQVGVKMDKVALVIDAKAGTTSRIGYVKDNDGKTVRVARQANNREVK